tara:strand:+ start:2586 stop:2933 length:348 start_codon:yes stop_codon:yes gene_type:complete
MNCNCDCHKQDNLSKLKKCEDRGKAKDKKIKELEKKILTLTLVAAIIGTIVGKEAVDSVIEYFNTFNEVKSTIVDITTDAGDLTIDSPVYYGISPAPSSLAIFALLAFTPPRRRR